MTRATSAAVLVLLLSILPIFPQQPDAKQEKPPEANPEEEGIPVTSDLVRKACGACHPSDDKNQMTRISFRRTTPEGWQETIKRMVQLNNVELEPQTAREVLAYLADNHGLAPEEARPAMFEVERRMVEYKYTDRDTDQTCSKCHSMGRVISQRRTRQDWELLMAMHRGYYPLTDFQAFRRMGPPQREPGPDGRPPDNRHPMDKAVSHLAGAFPLKTPEWSAWTANMRKPRLEGRWALSGYEPGKGAIYGQVRIQATESGADFTTEVSYTYARGGQSVRRTGRARVYTGYQWRGRSREGGDAETALREVMLVERDWQEMSGRWFRGAYDEFGIDVKMIRTATDPILTGVSPSALRTSGKGILVRLHGSNLPAGLSPSAIDFGRGVTVTRVTSSAPDLIAVEVDVEADAVIGARDLFAGGATLKSAVTLYDKIDVVKVFPKAGMARVGGVAFPRQYQQFEAVAFHNGPDGKPDTADDLKLDLVDVAWSLEEYTAVFGDDDRQFVGTLDRAGLFTPNIDGPNPERRNNTNNFGDVWVVATYKPEGDGKPIRARAHLLVTVPLYMKWDQPEVAR